MQRTWNTLDTWAVTAACASDFIFTEHKVLGQGGEVLHMKTLNTEKNPMNFVLPAIRADFHSPIFLISKL